MTKLELTKLRVHMAELETYKELYTVNEDINKSLKLQIDSYKNLVQAKDGTIVTLQTWNKETQQINNNLKDVIETQNKKLKSVPYLVGGGFLGGLVLCLLLK
jgi:hypothetical protein